MNCIWDNENGPRVCTVCGIPLNTKISGTIYRDCGLVMPMDIKPNPDLFTKTEHISEDAAKAVCDRMRESIMDYGKGLRIPITKEVMEQRISICQECSALQENGCPVNVCCGQDKFITWTQAILTKKCVKHKDT